MAKVPVDITGWKILMFFWSTQLDFITAWAGRFKCESEGKSVPCFMFLSGGLDYFGWFLNSFDENKSEL